MDGQDQRAGLGDHEDFGGDCDALGGDLLDLGLERPRVEHHAIADHRRSPADDARREQRKLVGLVADDERVAGVVPALKADDHVSPACQPVDDFALAFVAPLGADDGDVAHVYSSMLTASGALGGGGRRVQIGPGLTLSYQPDYVGLATSRKRTDFRALCGSSSFSSPLLAPADRLAVRPNKEGLSNASRHCQIF